MTMTPEFRQMANDPEQADPFRRLAMLAIHPHVRAAVVSEWATGSVENADPLFAFLAACQDVRRIVESEAKP